MSGYSPYELLGVEPGQSFGYVASAFERQARQLDVIGASLDGRGEMVDLWRSLCEALDWLVKQPIRQPTKPITCTNCGTTSDVPLLALVHECTKCGNGLFPNPTRCTNCGTAQGIAYGADPRSFYCGACGKFTLEPLSEDS